MACLIHRSWALTIMASLLTDPALSKTSMFVILPYQQMLRIRPLDAHVEPLHLLQGSSARCPSLASICIAAGLARTVALCTPSFVDCQMFCCFNARARTRPRPWLALRILVLISPSMKPPLENTLRHLKSSTVFNSVPSTEIASKKNG